MQERGLFLYVSSSTHKCYAESFLMELSKRRASDYAVIRARLARAQAGNLGEHKLIGPGLTELKVSKRPGYRVYCTVTDDLIVILHINVKAEKKAQDLDIILAKKLLAEFRKEYKL